MVSTSNETSGDTTKEDLESGTAVNGSDDMDHTSFNVLTSQKGLMGQGNPRKRFMNIFTTLSKREGPRKFRSASILASSSARFRLLAEERDEISRSVVSTGEQGLRERFSVFLYEKINWVSLKKVCKEWIKNPMNIALLVWIICVAVSGAILFLVMTGMLNHVIPRKSQRDTWFEVNNQILNALFTLMCLYQHPKRFHHLVLLCRWRPEDVLKLRKIYCKNGTYKPHEWIHMMVVVVLLHINCFAQYALCGLNLGYRRSQRPAIGVGLCISVAIAAPAAAGVYSIVSPLGRDYESETDQEVPDHVSADADTSIPRRSKSLEKRYSFVTRDDQRVVESRSEWQGGLFDLWDDISIAYLSMFCCFCVFGWNMERLGFGNMYVHIATFLLFCMAPFWIFNLAAVNIDNEAAREALGIMGIVLCVFGLLYGGFWRIQMRKRFNLPGSLFCFGCPAVIDCMQWLCCCTCSLAQEVRTANFYDIGEDKFYRKQMGDNVQPSLSPLPHEDGSPLFTSGPSSPLQSNSSPSRLHMVNFPSPTRFTKANIPDGQLEMIKEELSAKSDIMTPPAPSLIEIIHTHPI